MEILIQYIDFYEVEQHNEFFAYGSPTGKVIFFCKRIYRTR